MPNNNTAYSILKINLSFISFLWVERWSGGADVDSTHALAFSKTDTEVCVNSAAQCRQGWTALATEVQGGGANFVDFNFERD